MNHNNKSAAAAAYAAVSVSAETKGCKRGFLDSVIEGDRHAFNNKRKFIRWYNEYVSSTPLNHCASYTRNPLVEPSVEMGEIEFLYVVLAEMLLSGPIYNKIRKSHVEAGNVSQFDFFMSQLDANHVAFLGGNSLYSTELEVSHSVRREPHFTAEDGRTLFTFICSMRTLYTTGVHHWLFSPFGVDNKDDIISNSRCTRRLAGAESKKKTERKEEKADGGEKEEGESENIPQSARSS